jgi:hypothetical protein
MGVYPPLVVSISVYTAGVDVQYVWKYFQDGRSWKEGSILFATSVVSNALIDKIMFSVPILHCVTALFLAVAVRCW